MFYAYSILAKKGPLANVWLAAHWNKKLTKSAVFQTNVATSCRDIEAPPVPYALRMSGHLLLGVVTVYSRQVQYLYTDCNEAMHKIRMAFKTGDVNLPDKEHGKDSSNTIQAEGFGDFAVLPTLDFESDFEESDDGADDMDDGWTKLDAVTFADVPDSSMDEDEEMLPAAEEDDLGGSTMGHVDSLPGSEASMPVFRRDADTPVTRRDTVGLDDGKAPEMELEDDMDMGFGEDQYDDEEELPPPLEDEDEARRQSKMSIGTPLADMDIDGTPVTVRVKKVPEVDLITEDDLGDLSPSKTKTKTKLGGRSGSKKRARVQDDTIALPKTLFKEWKANTAKLLLPRQTTAKRLRRQREVSEIKFRRAVGYKNPEDMLYLPPCMKAACPELLEAYADIAKGGFPPAKPGDFSDDEGVGAGGEDAAEVSETGMMMDDEDDIGFGEDELSDEGVMYNHGDEFKGDDGEEEEEELGLDVEDAGAGDLMGEMGATSGGEDEEDDPDKLKDMMKVLSAGMDRAGGDEVVYQELSHKQSRHLVADCFWKVLKLKSLNLIELAQDEPYGEIKISKMPTFDTAMESGSINQAAAGAGSE